MTRRKKAEAIASASLTASIVAGLTSEHAHPDHVHAEPPDHPGSPGQEAGAPGGTPLTGHVPGAFDPGIFDSGIFDTGHDITVELPEK